MNEIQKRKEYNRSDSKSRKDRSSDNSESTDDKRLNLRNNRKEFGEVCEHKCVKSLTFTVNSERKILRGTCISTTLLT